MLERAFHYLPHLTSFAGKQERESELDEHDSSRSPRLRRGKEEEEAV
jgi:hypothetical protein